MGEISGSNKKVEGDMPQRRLHQLIELCAVQVQAAYSECSRDHEEVTRFFLKVVEDMDERYCHTQEDEQEREDCSGQLDEARKGLMALQAFDAVEQRMEHIRDSLLLLSDFLNEDTCLKNHNNDLSEEQWQKLTQSMSLLYTTTHEKRLLDMGTNGVLRASLFEEADKPCVDRFDNDDIDLF